MAAPLRCRQAAAGSDATSTSAVTQKAGCGSGDVTAAGGAPGTAERARRREREGGERGRDHWENTGELRLLFCLNNDCFGIRASAQNPRATCGLLKVTTRNQAQGNGRLSGSRDRGRDTAIPFLWPTAPAGRGEQLVELRAPQPSAPFVCSDKGAGHVACSSPQPQAQLQAWVLGGLSVVVSKCSSCFGY